MPETSKRNWSSSLGENIVKINRESLAFRREGPATGYSSSLHGSKRLLRNHGNLGFWLQIGVSVLAASLSLLYLAKLFTGWVDSSYRLLAIVSALLVVLVYHKFGVYRRYAGWMSGLKRLAQAWLTVVALVLFIAFITKTSTDYSRSVIVIWAVGGYAVQAVSYLLMSGLYAWLRQKYSDAIPALVVGSGELAENIINCISRNDWLQDHVVGVIEDDPLLRSAWDEQDAPVLGGIDVLEETISKHLIRRVYITLPLSEASLIESLHRRLLAFNVDVVWAPDIFHLNLLNHSVKELAGIPLISLSESPVLSNSNAFVKSIMDIAISMSALIALSPVLLAIATIIKLTSPGPVIFKQRRHGWDGRVIEIWKFRSMYLHKEEAWVVTQATKNDSRITPIGKFIRRTSIDELPQLFNVLQGTMSLVGPRPHALSHNNYYCEQIEYYSARHRIKPGITGLAQVKGLRGETESVQKMQDRVEQDISYIRNWSPWLDVKILCITPFCLLSRNAY